MSKGLEDLKWLIEAKYIEQHGWQEDIVMLECVDNIEKELKALEIIKREPSMVGWQAGYEDYEDYLDNTPEEQRFIKNKEEFDLLKEVLE